MQGFLQNVFKRRGGETEAGETAAGQHAVLGRAMRPPYPEGCETACFGMGCFWGAERLYWQLEGVWVTAVGYAGGSTPSPTYREVCSGRTGHAEVVLVAYQPSEVAFESLLQVFWEGHDPTQLNRQGNDIGTQYRSVILVSGDDQKARAEASRTLYGERLAAAGYGPVATEISPLEAFHHAEDYHQQYLHKNPGGYCGLGGTGVACAAAA